MPNTSFAKILAHSINDNGDELITYHLRYPRLIHAEFMTHKSICKNGASSRAIPIPRMVEQAKPEHRYVPTKWFKGRSGMQPGEQITDPEQVKKLANTWNEAADSAVEAALALMQLGTAKQIANRLLEPFLYMEIIATSTNWANFFHLRVHPDAQDEIDYLAGLALKAKMKSTPERLKQGEYHCPYKEYFLTSGEKVSEKTILQCAGKIARVSYARQDDEKTPGEQLALGESIKGTSPLHASPFEHIGQADALGCWPHLHGPFRGFAQERKKIPWENIYYLSKEAKEAKLAGWEDRHGVDGEKTKGGPAEMTPTDEEEDDTDE